MTKRTRRPNFKWNAETCRYVVDAYRQGMSGEKIAVILGVNSQAIYAFLHREGVPVRPNVSQLRNRKLTPVECARIRQRHRSGEFITILCRDFQCTEASIREVIAASGDQPSSGQLLLDDFISSNAPDGEVDAA